MTHKDQVFVTNVVVTNLMRKTVVSCVINQLVGVVVELKAIAKTHKYRKLHEGHHFVLMP
jgi:hypothetical protein